MLCKRELQEKALPWQSNHKLYSRASFILKFCVQKVETRRVEI